MASAIAAISAANASKMRQQKQPKGGPGRFQPTRQLRLVKRDEDGEIIEVPFWPPVEGDSCLEKVRSFCWNLYEYPENSWLSHWINVFIMGCIVLSALVMVIESIPGALLRQRCSHLRLCVREQGFIKRIPNIGRQLSLSLWSPFLLSSSCVYLELPISGNSGVVA